MVDKEMAATSAAIEDAVRRIEVRAARAGAGYTCLPWASCGGQGGAVALASH